MRGRICPAGKYFWDDYHHCKLLIQYLQLGTDSLAPLFWSDGVFPVQACPDVPAGQVQGISSRPKVADLLRRHHAHSHYFDHHQCLRVHAQLPQGTEATYQPEEGPQRGRKDNRAVVQRCRPNAVPNDDRLAREKTIPKQR